MKTITLGDMTVTGEWPPRLMRALAVIADVLHPALNRQDWIVPDKSRESCVLCSLAVRDFLSQVGYPDAVVRPVACVMKAERSGKELHSLGVGLPPRAFRGKAPDTPAGRWNGHLVCTVPSQRLLIDTTLYQAQRQAWRGAITGMFATRFEKPHGPKMFGYRAIASLGMHDGDDLDYLFQIVWLDRRDNMKWTGGDDCQEWRRSVAVSAMRERWGAFEGAAA